MKNINYKLQGILESQISSQFYSPLYTPVLSSRPYQRIKRFLDLKFTAQFKIPLKLQLKYSI